MEEHQAKESASIPVTVVEELIHVPSEPADEPVQEVGHGSAIAEASEQVDGPPPVSTPKKWRPRRSSAPTSGRTRGRIGRKLRQMQDLVVDSLVLW